MYSISDSQCEGVQEFSEEFYKIFGRGQGFPVISEPRIPLQQTKIAIPELFQEISHSLRAWAWLVDLGAFPARESMGRTCDVTQTPDVVRSSDSDTPTFPANITPGINTASPYNLPGGTLIRNDFSSFNYSNAT